MTPRARALTAVLGLVAALVAVATAPAQAPRPHYLEETHAFRRILYDLARTKKHELKPLRSPDAVNDPWHTLIVVLGDPRPLYDLDNRLWPDRAALRQENALFFFVNAGGALLVASDQTTKALEPGFGWSIDGDLLRATAGSDVAYRGIAECPFVEPKPGQEPPLFQPAFPVVRGQPPPKIASNLSSYLRLSQGRRSPIATLATLPGSCRDELGRAGNWTFAAGGTFGRGRVLIMADHSVFINEMMLQTDNGNIDFASRCADWLLTVPDGMRDQVLYYEDGKVRTDFDIPLKELPTPPLPPPETLMGMIEETMHGMEQDGTFRRMEENDYFNGLVGDLADEVPVWQGTPPEWKLWTLATIAASVLLGLYAFVRLGMFRHRGDVGGPTLDALMAKQAPAGAAIDQRQEALLRHGQLWEAARELARHLFAAAGVAPDAGTVPPPLEVRGGWWLRLQVRRRWRQFWHLARLDRPVRVSSRGFARLAARVRALEAALADGTVRVVQ